MFFYFFVIAQVRQITSEAPAISNVFAHSSSEVPVVLISSQRRILLPVRSNSSFTENTPKTLPALADLSRKCCSSVSKSFVSKSTQGSSKSSHIFLVKSSAWLKPRIFCLLLCIGIKVTISGEYSASLVEQHSAIFSARTSETSSCFLNFKSLIEFPAVPSQ